MCGIFGTINYPIQKEQVYRHLYHRGPDEQGYEEWENVQLFHLRLSIVDLIGGQQPMSHRKWAIIYNGEFYNHLEIRKKYGLDCVTQSDTETLLKFYELKQESCFDEIDGMFALAILDKTNNSILLARDRSGKKPLYLARKDSSLIFSSELNAISKSCSLSIDYGSIDTYLKGCMYGVHTPYSDVHEIEAGSLFTIDCNSLETTHRSWWNIEDIYHQKKVLEFDNCLSMLDEQLTTSVQQRLVQSDLEVGTFLSGGIDSGLVTAIAANSTPRIKSFTVKFEGEFDESSLAKLVADKYETDHYEIKIDFNSLQTDFENIVMSYGEPFSDSSAIPSYYVAKEAKKHVSVVLNGDGADEIFGGYRRYVPFAKFDLFRVPEYVRALCGALRKILPNSRNKKSKYNYIYRFLSLVGSGKDELYWYATTDTFAGYFQYFVADATVGQFSEISTLLVSNDSLSSLEKIMLLDFNILMSGVLLVKMDIATMQHSLEGRSPFLSKGVLELAPRIPNQFKVNGTTTKFVLRELAKKYLPETIIGQPKRGFEVPLKKWVNSDLKPLVYDYLGSPNSFSQEFVSGELISDLLHKPNKFPQEKRAKMLYRMLVLEIWKNGLR